MIYFFTRRRLKRGTDAFSDKFATVTRYIEIDETAGGAFKGVRLPVDKWARRVLSQSQNGEVLIYVHGFNTSQFDLIKRLRTFRSKLGFKGAIIGFDWPTGSTKKLTELFKVYRKAKTNVNKLDNILVTDGLNPLWKADTGTTLHVMGHSMGAYAIANAFSRAPTETGPIGKNWSVGEAIFSAADIDARMMKKRGGYALTMQERSARLTHHYSAEDKVLQISGQMHDGHPRSGRAGIAPDIAKGLIDVSMQDRYLSQTPTHQQETRHSHSWYLDDRGFLTDLDLVLRGVEAKKMKTRQPGQGGDQRLVP